MPRCADWETDAAFLAVARVAWERDFDYASLPEGQVGLANRQRVAARRNMKLRYEGFMHVEAVDNRLADIENAVRELTTRMPSATVKRAKRKPSNE